jgi:hypothetical protein
MTGWTFAALIVLSVAAYLLASGFLRTYRLYRGVRVITCPENLQPAAVRVAAFDAAKWFAIAGEKDVHLRDCSRWPEMAGCDEACLSQVEASPQGCLVHTIVTAWYSGKSCHYCARPIGRIVWHERPPAVRLADGQTKEWKDIAPEQLPSVFATAEAVCWACHIVEGFRREHPEMVIERIHPADAKEILQPTEAVY